MYISMQHTHGDATDMIKTCLSFLQSSFDQNFKKVRFEAIFVNFSQNLHPHALEVKTESGNGVKNPWLKEAWISCFSGDTEGHSPGGLRGFHGTQNDQQEHQSDSPRRVPTLPYPLPPSMHQVNHAQLTDKLLNRYGHYQVSN